MAQIVPLWWTKGPPELQIRNVFKGHLLLNHWSKFKIISQNCFSWFPLSKLHKWFCSAEQKGARVPDKKYLKKASPPESLVRIQNNFTEVLLIVPSTKIAQINQIRLTKVQPELQIRNIFKRHFQNHWSKLKIISQNCSSWYPLPNYKWFCSTKQRGCQGSR